MNQVNVHIHRLILVLFLRRNVLILFPVCVFADGTDDQSARSSLEKRCEHLQKQVWEMEVGFEGTFFIQGVEAKVIDSHV